MGGGGKGGSDPQQVGTAQSPGDYWMQTLLQPNLLQARNRLYAGQPMYNVPNAPQAPTAQGYDAQGYTAQGYTAPQMPYSSPTDYLQRGEMDTARNVMESFYGQGGGGSATGGGSGAGFDREAALSAQLGQGAIGRYMNAQLPYAQMGAQASQFGAGAQNQASQFGAGAQNQASQFGAGAQNQMGAMGYGGQMQQYGYQNQAMNPSGLLSMYPGSTGNPMVNPGQQGKGMGDMMLGSMMGMSMIPEAAAGMAMLSDIRLKKNVRKIGKHKGMDVIEFEYLWGGGRQVGLIAQQVRDVIPHAVGNINGYLYVDYGRV